MEPLLHNGQTIIILRGKNPRRGDVLVFESPEDGRLVVKRCVLAPGYPLTIEKEALMLSNKRIPLTAGQLKKLSKIPQIPDNQFFAVGDNVYNSHDSRDYGPVLIEKLKGKVLLIK